MSGWKTIISFTIIGLLGLLTALETIDVKAILLPLVCHTDPALVMTEPADDCAGKVIKLAGYWTTAIAAVGMVLRAITSSAIFKGVFKE